MSTSDVLNPVPMLNPLPSLVDSDSPSRESIPLDLQVQAIQHRIDFSCVRQTFWTTAERVKQITESVIAAISWRISIIREVFLRLIFVPSINPHSRSFIQLIDSFAEKKPILERQFAEIQSGFMDRVSMRRDLNRLAQLKTDVEYTLTQLRLFTAVTADWKPALPIHDRIVEIQGDYDQFYQRFTHYMIANAPRILNEFYQLAAPFVHSSIPLPPNIRDDLYTTYLLVQQHAAPFVDLWKIPQEFHSLVEQLRKAHDRPDHAACQFEYDRPLLLRNVQNSCYIDSTLQMLFSQNRVRERLMNRNLEETMTKLKRELQDPALSTEVVSYKLNELVREENCIVHRQLLQQELIKLMCVGEYVPGNPVSYLDYFLAISAEPSVSKIRRIIAEGRFNPGEFNFGTMRAQLDAASFLDVVMREVLGYSFCIQTVANTPAMPGRLFLSRQEPAYGLQLSLHKEIRDLNTLIASNLGVENVYEPDERYQRIFDPQEGMIIDAEAAGGEILPMRVEQYSIWPRLQSLQDVMTIQIKRFGSNASGMMIKKEDEIDLPEDGIVDLTPFYDPPGEGDREARYEITGMVIHSGVLHGGHYTACVKQGECYWSCDDMGPFFVKQITREEFFANKKPYLLILQRIPSN